MTDLASAPTTPRDEAIARVKSKRAFNAAVASYVLANVVVWLVWALTDGPSDGGMPWPLWITGFGALGLAGQAWSVFGQRPITEAEIQREVDRAA